MVQDAMAAVYLPQDAMVTGLYCYTYDNSTADATMSWRL